MARRSATNARYQKYTGPEGKTRKSAAAAKPKKASSSSAKPSGGKSSGGSKPKSTSAIAMRNPDTPEFRAYRRQWWIALVAGLLLTGVSYAIQRFAPPTTLARYATTGTLVAAYAAIIYAFFVDWTKMRPLRKEAYEAAKSGKSPKPAAEKKPTEDTSDGKDA